MKVKIARRFFDPDLRFCYRLLPQKPTCAPFPRKIPQHLRFGASPFGAE
jgi:hypothetical protein